MPVTKLERVIGARYDDLKARGALKGRETVITGVKPAEGRRGPRYFIEGYGERGFIRMNSNSYLGMSLRKEIIEAEEEATRKFGTGPGAVRFISGTYEPHVALEKKLAAFHGRVRQ
jgi:glycine C-acetyltransferase